MSFKINRVYTRSGDNGETGLVGGARISKTSHQITALGDIDELNAYLGIVKEYLVSSNNNLSSLFEFLQQELFDIGSEVATPSAAKYEGMWVTSESHVKNLERLCDKFSAGLPELESFILPGGSFISAYLHLARTVARRAERSVILFSMEQANSASVNQELIKYLNRLSDLIFILARFNLQVEGISAPLWVKGDMRVCPE